MPRWIVLSILVARSVSARGAALRLVLADAAGNRKGARRQVTLAAAARDFGLSRAEALAELVTYAAKLERHVGRG